MSTPIPARGAGQPATTSSSKYTHRTWLDEMADALGHIAGVYKDLTVMDATLTQVRAGRTQMALVEACEATGMDIMRTGVGFVDATDRRYMPVFEAIQKAGGQAEVAQDKRYHDRD